MGPGYFIIAILGCADGSTACTSVATVPTRYESHAACAAATGSALASRTDLDFPTLQAECRPATHNGATRNQRSVVIPAGSARG